PLVGFAEADDPLFERFRDQAVIGPHYLTPTEWLPGAKTVISFFTPYTAEVRNADRGNFDWPTFQWLHARIDGQKLIGELAVFLQEQLREAGWRALIPGTDPRFRSVRLPYPDDPAKVYGNSSNWSERHAAFACGLGTFSLNRGLITRRGIAGRFGSLVTDLTLPPDPRPYGDEPFAYCSRCGVCAKHCPAQAISLTEGKSNQACAAFLDRVKARHAPYYGCGKCQLDVPCESGVPPQLPA
ncbi:MAG: epoxyqueuosine reductase, partial [Peptococcaceae bacterium]|nr:epoxyqueuosine reductase [Peptococcaceae bacterium]